VAFDFLRSWRGRLLGTLLLACGVWSTAWLTPVHLAAAARPVDCGALPVPLVPVQRSGRGLLAKGKLLVAGDGLRDPHFAEAVILLLEYNDQGAMGVIVNRSSRVKLSELLPRVQGLEHRADTIYEGGPVERSEILMLVHAAKEPEDSKVIFGDVYLSSSAELLKRLAADAPQADAPFRVYSGYAGWGAGQLDAEVAVGAWHIFPATAAAVFSARPDDLWQELLGRTTLRLARTEPWIANGTHRSQSNQPNRINVLS
jgi:putative transcriptional regulator